MIVKVLNINGTGKNARNISESWLEYWKRKSGKKATKCLAYDWYNKEKNTVTLCGETDNLVGGHVQIVGSESNQWYIMPICKSHNGKNQEYWAKKEDLISATE